MRCRTIRRTRARLRAMVAAVSAGMAAGSGVTLAQQQPPPFAPPVLAPAPAAEPAPGPAGGLVSPATAAFGAPGQLVVGADLRFSIIRASSSQSGASSSTSVLIQPGADYFILPNLSLGGLLSYAHGSDASLGTTTIGFQVRAGYNITINDAFTFWPRLGIGYSHGSEGGVTAYEIPIQLFAPVLWTSVPHFFIGVGPTIQTDLAATDAKLTFVGIQLVIGGYFGLR